MQRIKFPQNPGELGSCVVFVREPHKSQPIIVDVLSKRRENQMLRENTFKKRVWTNRSSVTVEGRADDGNLFISVESDDELGGSIFIDLKNKKNKGRFVVNCQGDIDISCDGDAALQTLKSAELKVSRVDGSNKIDASKITIDLDGLRYEDEAGNSIEVKDKKVTIKPKERLDIFEGISPIPKGDELVRQLQILTNRVDAIIDALKNAPTSNVTAYATGVNTSLMSITDKESYEHVNSDKSFTE
jgi:hypothetical protein